MTIDEFKWDVTYRNDIDTPEKVTEISALLSDYEHRGITWKSMKGSEIYENNVKKEYALRGEKLDGTSVIHLTGIGNLEDFNELKSEMEKLLATYGDSGAAKPATEPSGGAGPTGPETGPYKPEPITGSTSKPVAEGYKTPTGGKAKAGQPYTEDELNEFINNKGYGHKKIITPKPQEPSTEMPDFSAFFNNYPGRSGEYVPEEKEHSDISYTKPVAREQELGWYKMFLNEINSPVKLLMAGQETTISAEAKQNQPKTISDGKIDYYVKNRWYAQTPKKSPEEEISNRWYSKIKSTQEERASKESEWETGVAYRGKIIDRVNAQRGSKWQPEKVDAKAYKEFLSLLRREQTSKTST